MTKEEYSNILNSLDIERPKCKYCDEDIFYHDINIYWNRRKELQIRGRSYRTTKIVNNHTYNLCVCEDCLYKHHKIKNLSRTFNVMSEITKDAFNISDEDFNSGRRKYGSSLEHKIEKYGEEKGRELWDNYIQRQAETNSFEYKNKTYGMTKEEFDQYNQSRAVTKKNLIKRYGNDEGLAKWNNYIQRQRLTKSWEYMVDKYGIEKAREINRSKVVSLESYEKKYGEKAQEKLLEYYIKTHSGYSQVSQEFFRKLDSYLSPKYTTYFATKNSEYALLIDNKLNKLDYFIKDLNICIEFNGSCFHGDERLYRDDDHPNPFNRNLTAKQMRDRDRERYTKLKQLYNIETYVVWELDYKDIDVYKYIKETLHINI